MRAIRIRGTALWLALTLAACGLPADDLAGDPAATDAGVQAETAEEPETPAELGCSGHVESTPSPSDAPAAAAPDQAIIDPEVLASLPVLAATPPADAVTPKTRQRQRAYLQALAEREASWTGLGAAAREAAQAELKVEIMGGDL